ncbi:xanthine dehydrogenase family protein molybdopterin-binding subunit [Phytoactinopolyspora limicola]|uniref:xanthine dehydrogenase family protein molybdopterin-binding subunit n=1 Tax=Phytoactinopolyspora limicola TaxID=2715536 RepID=UPI00140E750D|nr:xanthine dehydrogenase family protein molybdopterin-binding subunit [Phytoactinopolyspora limicola]
MSYFGNRVQRREDPALLTGHGRFIADHQPPGTVHAAFTRSPLAHARIRSVDLSAARAVPGVLAVYTHDDLPGLPKGARLPLHVPNAAITKPHTQAPLADGEVCFAGEAVAVVVAENSYVAEDAAALVAVEYDDLPPVSDIESALNGGHPSHADDADNVAAQLTVGYGDVDTAFAEAAHVVQATLKPHRGGGHAMECRGVLAQPDADGHNLTVRSGTQAPHLVKRSIMDVLGLSGDQVRVIAPPDVGGGFGPKAIVYPEDIIVPALARALGRPVKWIEDRREHFLCTTQERDQIWTVEMALNGDGTLRGLRGTMAHDSGAYLPWGVIMPYISATTTPGPYVLPAYQLHVTCVLTNTVPTTPVRGAGRPQAVFAIERLLDQAADQIGLDRADIRRRNLIPADQMPYEVGLTYRDGSPVIYDSGDYPATLEAGLERAEYTSFAERQRAGRAEGRLLGIGMAFYVEGTGLGPFEGAAVRVQQDGRIVVQTSAAPQGQSHQTVLAQLAADQLGVDIDQVSVVTGDTATMPIGIGTFASRIAVNAGSSVHVAAREVRQKIVDLAAAVLEVDAKDVELADGEVQVAGVPGSGRTFGELARIAQGMPGFSMPGGTAPGLMADSYFSPKRSTYAHGFHVAEIEIDPETGAVDIIHYVVVHDCGKVINPMVVDGQVQGGLAHGVGNALLEVMRYDTSAQPTTTTFADYLLPEAADVPVADVVHLESPTDLNPLGIKGAGEGGTIPAAAAVIAAIENAVAETGVRINHHPVTPAEIHHILHTAAPAEVSA